MAETDAERLERVLRQVRVLLSSAELGQGPIRLERWNEPDWTSEQRGAYEELRTEAGMGVPEGILLKLRHRPHESS
jgi:hypothetical protein